MKFNNQNIIDFYKYDRDNHYLIDNFTNLKRLGRNDESEKNLFKKNPTKEITYLNSIDDHNDYYINELGFRGQLDNNSDIIGAGCSFTFGSGVPEEGRWTNILGKKINYNINNLASPGYSIQKICDLIINYSIKYKMPKKAFCLFPGFFRTMLVEDSNFYTSVKSFNFEKKDYQLRVTTVAPEIHFSPDHELMLYKNSEELQYAIQKNKKNIEDILSPHQYILDSVNAISTLESFCLFNNIELFWTTWDKPTTYLMDVLLKVPNFKLNRYNKLVENSYHNYLGEYAIFPKEVCNIDHDSKFIDSYCWNKGSDYYINDKHEKVEYFASHPGIHYHEHIADFFYKRVM